MRKIILITMLAALAVGMGYGWATSSGPAERKAMDDSSVRLATASFAGGCFWCSESDFEKHAGVADAVSGYTGGSEANPSYNDVASGRTGHLEAVQVRYDPTRISYAQLLDIFWRHINPTDAGGQFVDRGRQYRTAIFYHDEQQRRLAEASKADLGRSGRFDGPIVTEIKPLTTFYPAEDYHQDYHRKNPVRYKYYRFSSGRDRFVESIWSGQAPDRTGGQGTGAGRYRRPPQAELKKRLTPLQYHVTQEEGTERPFDNPYWDLKRAGIYVDVVSGEPLFSSTDKYDSKSGWPSFTRPLEPDNVVEREDRKLMMTRTEVRSRHGDSHLGHVFSDGPPPTGRRFCINSASLRFVAVDELETEGYGQYRGLFEK